MALATICESKLLEGLMLKRPKRTREAETDWQAASRIKGEHR